MSQGYEQKLSSRVREFANKHRDQFMAYKIKGGPFSAGGMPDWMFIGRPIEGDNGVRRDEAYVGRIVFIELKAPGVDLDPRQLEVSRVMHGHGARVFVAETLEQVKRALACQRLLQWGNAD